jgi:methyl-accepting chemotaxis protein
MTIRTRIWLMIASALLGLLLLGSFSLYIQHDKLLTEKKTQLTKMMDAVFSQLALYQEQVKTGKLSQEEAQTKAITYIKGVRYDNGNYFWINDRHPTMIMHPTNPKLDGKDLTNNQDKKGNYLFVRMVEEVKKQGSQGGFVEYYWNRPNGDIPVAKLSHVRDFSDWGWIVGTGIYIDDVTETFMMTLYELLSVAVIVMIGLLIVGLLLIRSLTLAVNEIVTGVASATSSMSFANRLSARKDEFSPLVSSVNHLFSQLQEGLKETKQVVSALANGDLSQRINGQYVGDLAGLKDGVNNSANNISTALSQLSHAMSELKHGNLHIQLSHEAQGIYGKILQDVGSAMGKISFVVNDINQIMDQMTQANFNARVNAEAEGELLKLKTNINSSMQNTADVIYSLLKVVEAHAQGDLTKELPNGTYKGQFHDLKNAMAYSTDKMREAIAHATQASHVVDNAANQVSQGASDLSTRVQEQAAAIEQTSATMTEMASAVSHNTDHAKRVSLLAKQVKDETQTGMEVMQKSISAMQEIQASSSQIADIVTLIDGIAFQTNLLALNAAVEAARAGDHGRGFAVVASEVRDLAQKSANAAKDIKSLITESVHRIEQGTQLAGQSGEMLQGITKSIEQVTQMIEEIAHASGEQSDGIDQVHRAMSSIDRVTQENAALVEETTAAAESLRNEAYSLIENMRFFKT